MTELSSTALQGCASAIIIRDYFCLFEPVPDPRRELGILRFAGRADVELVFRAVALVIMRWQSMRHGRRGVGAHVAEAATISSLYIVLESTRAWLGQEARPRGGCTAQGVAWTE